MTSSSWARKATTSWRVVASISSIRRASIRAARRMRSTASLGIRPRRAYTGRSCGRPQNTRGRRRGQVRSAGLVVAEELARQVPAAERTERHQREARLVEEVRDQGLQLLDAHAVDGLEHRVDREEG